MSDIHFVGKFFKKLVVISKPIISFIILSSENDLVIIESDWEKRVKVCSREWERAKWKREKERKIMVLGQNVKTKLLKVCLEWNLYNYDLPKSVYIFLPFDIRPKLPRRVFIWKQGKNVSLRAEIFDNFMFHHVYLLCII